MIINIEHKTTYTYDTDVKHSIQYIRLTPFEASNQRVIKWELITPGPTSTMYDGYGNLLHVLTVDKVHKELDFVSRGIVEISGNESIGDDGLNPILFLRQTKLTKIGEGLGKLLEKYKGDMRGIEQSLKDMSAEILAKVPYDKTKTNSKTTAEEALELGGGVCQDHTHIFVGLCRARNIPARYVSGFLYSKANDHVSTHAWAEAYYNNSWHTFDVSNQLMKPTNHVKIAIGLDYLSACPIRGVRNGGGDEVMDTETIVKILNDVPIGLRDNQTSKFTINYAEQPAYNQPKEQQQQQQQN